MGVTLAVTHYTGEAHLLQPYRNPSGAIETPTHPQNFQPKMHAVYKNAGMGVGAETEIMADQ